MVSRWFIVFCYLVLMSIPGSASFTPAISTDVSTEPVQTNSLASSQKATEKADEKPARTDKKYTALVEDQQARIFKELEQLTDHPWAGSYYQGDGLGANETLTLSPKSGIAFQWHGCLGLYDQNYGTVTFDGQMVKVQWALATDDKLDFPTEFLVVRWGERRYLIPPAEVLRFCNHIQCEWKWEPRKEVHGFYYLRRDDEKKEVKGKPELPKPFDRYWTMKNIEGAIKEVSLPTVTTEYEYDKKKITCYSQKVVLNIGEDEGLLPKMRLEPSQYDLGTFARIYVVKVRAKEAEAIAEFQNDAGEKVSGVTVGRKVVYKD